MDFGPTDTVSRGNKVKSPEQLGVLGPFNADEDGADLPGAGSGSFAGVLSSSYREMTTSFNFNSSTAALERAYDRRIELAHKFSGEPRWSNPYRVGGIENIPRWILGSEAYAKEFEEREAALAKKNPAYDAARSRRSLEAEQIAIGRGDAEAAQQEMQLYGPGAGKHIASFLGGAAAIGQDPIGVATAFLGFGSAGVGYKSLAIAAAKNAAVNAGLEGLQQYTVVANRRKELGLDPGNLLAQVAMAGVFGGTLDAGARGLIRGGNRAMGRLPILNERNHISGWESAEDARLFERVKAGDVDAAEELIKRYGNPEDPEVKVAAAAARFDEEVATTSRLTDVPEPAVARAYDQGIRAVLDDAEPAPRAPDPVNPSIGQIRQVLIGDADVGDVGAREALDAMPEAKASVEAWRAYKETVTRDDLKDAVSEQIKALDALKGRIRPLVEEINTKSTTPERLARIFKDDPVIQSRVKDSTSKRIQMGRDLSRLPDDLLDDVASGDINQRHAALVGELVDDPAQHRSMLDAIEREAPESIADARKVIAREKDAFDLKGKTDLLTTDPSVSKLDDVNGEAAQAQIDQLIDEIGRGNTPAGIADGINAGIAAAQAKILDIRHTLTPLPTGSQAIHHSNLEALAVAGLDPSRRNADTVRALQDQGLYGSTEWQILLETAEATGALKREKVKPTGDSAKGDGAEKIPTIEDVAAGFDRLAKRSDYTPERMITDRKDLDQVADLDGIKQPGETMNQTIARLALERNKGASLGDDLDDVLDEIVAAMRARQGPSKEPEFQGFQAIEATKQQDAVALMLRRHSEGQTIQGPGGELLARGTDLLDDIGSELRVRGFDGPDDIGKALNGARNPDRLQDDIDDGNMDLTREGFARSLQQADRLDHLSELIESCKV